MTEIRSQENAIILAAAQNLVSLGSVGAQLLLEGKESEEQIAKGINLLTVFTAYAKRNDLEDEEIDSLLYCLRSLSEDDYFPTTSPIVGQELNAIIKVVSGNLSWYNEGTYLGDGITEVDLRGSGLVVSRAGSRITVSVVDISLLIGNVVLVGEWDASVDLFPTTGGTGFAGAIQKGNEFDITVGGILGGVDVGSGATIRAKVDSPGQTLANWRIYY